MTSIDKIRLVMLPGLASDLRLFAAQRQHFANIVVPDWPNSADSVDPQAFAQLCWNDWTLTKHATATEPAIPADQPYMLAGTSVGGIVALEIAWLAHRLGKPPLAVLLISSCRSWQAVPAWYGRWSDWANKLPQWIASKVFARRHVLHSVRHANVDEQTAQLIEAMYRSIDWPQLLMLARMMAGWRREESDLAKAPFPIHQLHGRLDSLLPQPSTQHATLLLDAGHWMCATHAAAVNNWIDAILQDAQLKLRGPKPISGKQ